MRRVLVSFTFCVYLGKQLRGKVGERRNAAKEWESLKFSRSLFKQQWRDRERPFLQANQTSFNGFSEPRTDPSSLETGQIHQFSQNWRLWTRQIAIRADFKSFPEPIFLNQMLPSWKPGKFQHVLKTKNSETDTSSLQARRISIVTQNRELRTSWFLLANRTKKWFLRAEKSEPDASSLQKGQVSTVPQSREL